MEGQTATLECVVSKADQPAKWLRKGKALPKDNRITTSVDKNTHRLVLQSVTIDDEMEYSVKIGDKVSKATIFVEGMNFLPFFFISILIFNGQVILNLTQSYINLIHSI